MEQLNIFELERRKGNFSNRKTLKVLELFGGNSIVVPVLEAIFRELF